mmetsp:Transcript_16969/g.59406  ORF Transcript_16969/g.59406 Transcript_16969/m.59406 type:complete len:217 (+) Transcript_16969:1447-2097(+)
MRVYPLPSALPSSLSSSTSKPITMPLSLLHAAAECRCRRRLPCRDLDSGVDARRSTAARCGLRRRNAVVSIVSVLVITLTLPPSLSSSPSPSPSSSLSSSLPCSAAVGDSSGAVRMRPVAARLMCLRFSTASVRSPSNSAVTSVPYICCSTVYPPGCDRAHDDTLTTMPATTTQPAPCITRSLIVSHPSSGTASSASSSKPPAPPPATRSPVSRFA